MKKIIIFLLVLLAANCSVQAQAPQGFNFQGIALDGNGYVVASKLVSLRFSISTDSLGSAISYQESVSAQTDKYGQFTTVIGSGNPSIGDFKSIPWATGNLFMKTEIDIEGAGTYVTVGLAKLLSVPYALQANSASNITSDSLQNTRVGSNSLYKNTTGQKNTATGDSSLYSNTTGYRNTASGYQSLFFNTSGIRNTADGIQSLYSNTTGEFNTAVGSMALWSNTTGSSNIAIGMQSLNSNTTGRSNTAIGFAPLFSNTTGSYNTAIGNSSGGKLTTGNYNVFLGNQSGNNSIFATVNDKLIIDNRGSANPLIYGEFDNKKLTINGDLEVTGALKGSFSKVFKNGSNTQDTMFLADDVDFYETGDGFWNPVVSLPLPNSKNSYLTKRLNTSLLFNCRSTFSFKILKANTDLVDELTLRTGEYAIFTYAYNRWILTGKSGGLADISSDTLFNTRVGAHSLEKNTTGSNNTANGHQSLSSNTTGGSNTANGAGSLLSNTTGANNTATGYKSLSNNATGADNVAFGKAAGRFLTDGSTANTTSDYSVYLGSDTKASAENAQNEIVIGYSAIGSGSNTIQLGNTAVTDVKTSGAISASGIISSTRGIRPPSITLSQRRLITDSLSGMVIWCNNCGISGQMQVYNGVEWTDLTGQVAAGVLKTYVPDNNFEQALITLGYDDVLDDSVLTNNISSVKVLNIEWKSIQSLQGIQDFKYLEELDVRTNKLSTLDVTRNVYLKKLLIDNKQIPSENYNTISSLDLSNNSALQVLSIMDNKFISIDVTRNINLLELYIGNNHSTANNSISGVDLSKNTKLTVFKAGMIPMSTINLSANPLITDLGLTGMPITSVNLSGLTSLVSLNLGGTQITNLDLSSLTSLQTLHLLFNTTSYLTSLVVPVNLQSISIRSTALTSVDLTRCSGLKTLSLESTSLTSGTIFLNTLTALESMNFRSQTNFGNINFANHPNLKSLYLFSLNSISSINTSYLLGLNYLFLDNIPISVLDISGLTLLKSFRATNISTLSCIKANQTQINSRAANNLNWPIDNGTSFALICK